MKNDGKTIVIKCNNREAHNKLDGDGEGNVLIFLRGDSIFIRCTYKKLNKKCKRWNRIRVSLPGQKVNFTNASFLQALMPEPYHFDANIATVVLEDS